METFHRFIEVSTNLFPSVPIGYAVYMKEIHENMKKLLCTVNYDEFKWQISGNLKVIAILLGLEQVYTKFCRFLCLWGSHAGTFSTDRSISQCVNHFNLEYTMFCMNHSSNQAKLFSLLFMLLKLGLTKNFIKAMDKTLEAFLYLFENISRSQYSKNKRGGFH